MKKNIKNWITGRHIGQPGAQWIGDFTVCNRWWIGMSSGRSTALIKPSPSTSLQMACETLTNVAALNTVPVKSAGEGLGKKSGSKWWTRSSASCSSATINRSADRNYSRKNIFTKKLKKIIYWIDNSTDNTFSKIM